MVQICNPAQTMSEELLKNVFHLIKCSYSTRYMCSMVESWNYKMLCGVKYGTQGAYGYVEISGHSLV